MCLPVDFTVKFVVSFKFLYYTNIFGLSSIFLIMLIPVKACKCHHKSLLYYVRECFTSINIRTMQNNAETARDLLLFGGIDSDLKNKPPKPHMP
jgi:hypothetical protein